MVDKAILIRYSVIQNIIITVFRLDFITCLLFIRLHSLSFYLQFISALQRPEKCCLSCHVVIVRLIQFKEKAYSCSFYSTALLSQFFGELKEVKVHALFKQQHQQQQENTISAMFIVHSPQCRKHHR